MSKFGKSRLVPLHPTTVTAPRSYLGRPDRPRLRIPTTALFSSSAGTRLRYCVVNRAFLKLVRHAGLRRRSAGCRPWLHDLRHTFAVRTVLDAYRADLDVRARLPILSTYLGHVSPAATYWYLSAAPELLEAAGLRLERHLGDRPSARSPRLSRRSSPTGSSGSARRARRRSPPTATRCGCSLAFAAGRTGAEPSRLDVGEIDAPLVGAFLDRLETDRGNGVRTRNARLAAIRSLFRFAALRHPEHAESIGRVLAIPPKRFSRSLVTFLTDREVEALLAAADRATWTGRRDHALLLLAVQTGLRASELIGLRRATSISRQAPT